MQYQLLSTINLYKTIKTTSCKNVKLPRLVKTLSAALFAVIPPTVTLMKISLQFGNFGGHTFCAVNLNSAQDKLS